VHDVDPAARERRQLLLEDQRARWESGERVRAEDYRVKEPGLPAETLLDLVQQEVAMRRAEGDVASPRELEARFPELADRLAPLFERNAALDFGLSTLGTVGVAAPSSHAAAPQDIPGYELLEPLGRGGMGVVHRARQTSLDRKVALKFLAPDVARDADALARFQREARTVSALNHPHICTIHDLGQHDGRPFIAMELIAGKTLHAHMRAGTPLDANAIVAQVAAALAVAHDAGVEHRDVKPDNIIVRDDGWVKVVDFGLARLVGDPRAPNAWSVTAPGAILGTPRYMSPEQLRGEPADEASDVFSLGIVWYELATGRHPFAAASLAAMV
jgi:serine/threonine protein kinase